jgi:DNA-binding GntR family transcriptional regulator
MFHPRDPNPGTTIADSICSALAKRIVCGDMHPGQRIEELAVAAEFGASRTPVREALRQLAAMGLVDVRARKGATVIDPRIEDLAELFEALGEIEALCARFSAQRMTPVERRQLQVLARQGQAALRDGDHEAYSDCNEALHKLVYRGTRNRSIEQLALNLWNRLAPFRRSTLFGQNERMKHSQREHGEIVAAIAAGDAERAASAMRDHVVNSSLNAVDYLGRERAR